MENVNHSETSLFVAVTSYNSIKDAKWLNTVADKVEARKPEKTKMINNLRQVAKNCLASLSLIRKLEDELRASRSRELQLRIKYKATLDKSHKLEEQNRNLINQLMIAHENM